MFSINGWCLKNTEGLLDQLETCQVVGPVIDMPSLWATTARSKATVATVAAVAADGAAVEVSVAAEAAVAAVLEAVC
jgi:hypothetical protein